VPTQPPDDDAISEFDADTRLDAIEPGVFTTVISDRWSVGAGANGGYVAGLLARSLLRAGSGDDPADRSGHVTRHLRSVTVHLLAPAMPGPALVRTEVLRAGRSATVIDATLSRDANPIAVARGVIAADRDGPRRNTRTAPTFPDPATMRDPGWPDPLMVRSRYDTRYAVGGFPPERGDVAEISGWIRPIDGAPVGPAHLVAICDAFPPPVMMLDGPSLTARTMDFTVHLFETLDPPYPGWIAVTNRSTVSIDGYIETETESWSEDGTLLAQARQLSALAPWTPAENG
jgi:hypothetical protein